MLRIDIITIFPGLFEAFVRESMIGIAIRDAHISIDVHDLRHYAEDRHHTVDDSPFGGGPGMVMKPDPLVHCIDAVAGPKGEGRKARVILLSPQGATLSQARFEALAREEHVVLVCGRYEGVDQRAIELAIEEEISIGDYVLCGGEVPAMALIEGMTRLIPGVLGNPESVETESFQDSLLEGPHYTRPAEFRGLRVPDVLLSGDHAAIANWRAERAREFTRQRRPDLLGAAEKIGDNES